MAGTYYMLTERRAGLFWWCMGLSSACRLKQLSFWRLPFSNSAQAYRALNPKQIDDLLANGIA